MFARNETERAERLAGLALQGCEKRRGSALVPTLIVVTAMATLSLAMLSSGIDGSRNLNHEVDDYALTSAVESVSALAAADLWSGYLAYMGGAPGRIDTFRAYLDSIAVLDNGPGGPPDVSMGSDWSVAAGVPVDASGQAKFHNVDVDAVRLFRRDDGDATQLYFTISAKTTRGAGLVNPVLNRGVQVIYTVEPKDFDGFDYAVLGNNVNCVFCHTQIDSVDRYFNADATKYGSFDRVKVGTLESLVIRDNMDGLAVINDFDADSFVAGAIYVRGTATDQDGNPIADWNAQTLSAHLFDSAGHIMEDAFGALSAGKFTPAAQPFKPFENLYLDYPTDYAQMTDGALPDYFPPPIPDDGGVGAPGTGNPLAAGNKVVDPEEFQALAASAQGSIASGVLSLIPPGSSISTNQEYTQATFVGNVQSLGAVTTGNVVMTGTPAKPILLDGDVLIDGDVVITGYVKGSGTIVASGNVYIPTDLQYLDGVDGQGLRTFGIAADGTPNALGLAAGGNILIGDYLRPGTLTPTGNVYPGKYEIIGGDAAGKWSFSLAEMSLFNRGEWARTQPMLPAPGEADLPSTQWTVPNPEYAQYNTPTPYVPRYYHFGAGDQIPIYNKGNVGFDLATGSWHSDVEVPLEWDPALLTIVDPADTTSPLLYDTNGNSIAAVLQMTPKNGWLDDAIFKAGIEWWNDNRTEGQPFQIDGLLYTNNAIMAIVNRFSAYQGQMVMNGALVSSDLGVLVPSIKKSLAKINGPDVPGSNFKVGLQLNYDERVKSMLNVTNPYQVTIKRTLWNPTANLL